MDRETFTAVDLAHARRRLIVFCQWCADAGVPELITLASTIDRWAEELLAFHTTGGASNGPAEAVNLLIENTRREGGISLSTQSPAAFVVIKCDLLPR